ncbi:MAG: T9SS type A sorting domain-containing protein [Chitinispirillaceae bacterium]|nr:T9SS type A sorting domain-containing protein [Chitinispirillaceae bacterium]
MCRSNFFHHHRNAMACGLVLIITSLCSSLTITVPIAGNSLTVNADGSYILTTVSPAWSFRGTLGKALTAIEEITVGDQIGPGTGISFKYTDNGSLEGSINLYQNGTVLFTTKALTRVTSLSTAFPNFTTFPNNPNVLGYAGLWGAYRFSMGSIAGDSPLASFDDLGNTFVFGPAANFFETAASYSTSSIKIGLRSMATNLPIGYQHVTLLAVGKGINNTWDIWGQTLRAYNGKTPRLPDEDIVLKTLGYYTDNGAGYYYSYDAACGAYDSTLLAVKERYAKVLGINLGYMMLDSWWYDKGCGSSITWNSANGVYKYLPSAAPELFHNNFQSFIDRLKLPLQTQSRWYEMSCAPLAAKYPQAISGGLFKELAPWKEIIDPMAAYGLKHYEQDWLDAKAMPANILGDADKVFDNMAKACADKGITMQYCMVQPKNYLQASKYSNQTTIRVSQDAFNSSKFIQYLFASRLVKSVGSYPWVDVFPSSNIPCVMAMVASGGICAFSDRLRNEVAANILPVTRRDGVLVRPDATITPTDWTMIQFAKARPAGAVGMNYTDHGAGIKTAYLFITPGNYSFTPTAEGLTGNFFAYNYVNRTGSVITAGNAVTGTAASGSYAYYIVAPVGPSGVALLGDLKKYIGCGKQRVSVLAHSASQINATALLEPQEASVTLSGYGATQPKAIAITGCQVGSVSYNQTSKIFSVSVTPLQATRTSVVEMAVAIGPDPITGITPPKILPPLSLNAIIPLRGKIAVDVGYECSFKVRIFNLNGRLLFSRNVNHQSAWTSPDNLLMQGTYVVNLTTPQQSIVKKCMVR